MGLPSRIRLGAELQRTREKAHLTAAELGQRIGRSAGVVSAVERGDIRVTTRDVASVLRACGRAELWMITTYPPPHPGAPGRT